MQDGKLTDELKQMNSYYRLLCGLVNESMGVLHREGLSPEERLEELRAKLEFARRYLHIMPPSIRAELHANPRVQAMLADLAQRDDSDGGPCYLMLGDDGAFHEMVIDPEEELRPISDAELQALFPEE